MKVISNNQELLVFRIILRDIRVKDLHFIAHLKDMMLEALTMESEWFNHLIMEPQVKVNCPEDLVLLHME